MNEIENKGLNERVQQAIEKMRAEAGAGFSLERINLAELERRSEVSRAKLRRLKKNDCPTL